MKKIWFEGAWDDYISFQATDKKRLARINQLIRDTERTPFHGIGKPEPLKNDLSGWWSRRIDDENRLVYRVKGGVLEIAQCGSHYHKG